MDKDKLIEKSKHFFEKNETVKALHFTTDGQAFAVENRAQVHQRELTGNIDGIEKISRAEALPGTLQEVEVSNKQDDIAGGGELKKTVKPSKK